MLAGFHIMCDGWVGLITFDNGDTENATLERIDMDDGEEHVESGPLATLFESAREFWGDNLVIEADWN